MRLVLFAVSVRPAEQMVFAEHPYRVRISHACSSGALSTPFPALQAAWILGNCIGYIHLSTLAMVISCSSIKRAIIFCKARRRWRERGIKVY